LVLGAAFTVLVAAAILTALGGAVTGAAGAQRGADLAALSAVRSMRDDLPRLTAPARLSDGRPNPRHLGRTRYLARAVAAAREAAGADLREIRVFDVYRGEQVGEGRKSVAFSVVFQSPERTLSDADAAALRTRVADELRERFGAQLRSS
jgi:hypothetical protein